MQSRAENTGTSGSIAIESTAGKITATGNVDASSRNAASGNDISIKASGSVRAQTVSAAAIGSGASGNAGGVTISSNTGTIAAGSIEAQSNRINGNAGTVNLNSAAGITAADISAFTDTATGNAGSAGAINLATTNGNILANNVFSSTRAASGNAGNAGRFLATATNGNIELANLHSGAYVFGTGTAGNAGTISAIAGGNVTVSGRVDATSFGTVSQGAPGDIALTAANVLSANSINTLQTDLLPTASASVRYGNITLTGNEIDLTGGTNRVIGTGTIALQPFAADRNITLGGAANSGTTNLDLSATDLAALRNGFSSIVLGRSDSSSTISLAGNVTFKDPVTVRSPATSGSIDTRSFTITGTDNATINLSAGGNIFTGNITNPGRSIAIESTGGSIDTSGSTLKTSSTNNNGGPINLTARTEINLGAIDTSTAANNSTANAGTLSIDAGSRNITLSGNINTSAATGSGSNLNFNGNTRLARSIAIDTFGSNSSGSISFNNSLDGVTAENQNLTLNAGTGDITFSGTAGGSTSLGNLTANTSGTTAFNSVSAASLTTNSGGTTQLRGNVNTSGSQSYSDPVAIANNPILTGGEISFNNTVSGNSNLTVNAGTGNITFNGAIGSGNPLRDLTANTSGTTAFNNGVSAANLTTDGGGVTQLNNANVNTAGNQIYGDAVTVARNTVLTGDGITFNNTLNGNGNLTVIAGGGGVAFNSPIGNISRLGDLTATSQGAIASGNVAATSIDFTARGSVTAGNLDASATAGNGGRVRLNGESIATGDINTRGSFGGNVSAGANNAIAIGRIDSRGTANNGGGVTLVTPNSIRVVSIDTSGGTGSSGGSVDVTVGNFFRSTGVLPTKTSSMPAFPPKAAQLPSATVAVP
ncbi:MAG: S-layer family protein [Microcoleus sp. SM1_3_4]|nr:S-layer family protein [Microcoleus sp. SM1_3_4]